MRHLFLFLLLVCCFQRTALSQLLVPNLPKNEKELDAFIKNVNEITIPQVTTLRRCTEMMENISHQYLQINRLIFKPEKDSGIVDFFGKSHELQSGHLQIVDLLNSLVSEFTALPEDHTQLVKILDQYEKKLDQFHSKARSQADEELVFIIYLNRVLGRLGDLMKSDVGDLHYMQQPFCMKNPDLKKSFNKLAEVMLATSKKVFATNEAINQARQKRVLLIQHVEKTLRQNIENRAITSVHSELIALKEQLLAILKLNNLRSSINGRVLADEIAYQTSSLNRAFVLRTVYLQFESTFRQFAIHQAIINDFKEQIKPLETLVPASEAGVYKRELRALEREIVEAIDELQKLGWKGLLQRQVRFNTTRMQNIDTFPPACKPLVEEHLAKASTTNDLVAFRALEPIYYDIIDTCRRP